MFITRPHRLRQVALAIMSSSIVSIAANGDVGDSAPIQIDEPTATMLVMLDVIDFAGSDEMGNDYFALAGTDMICYMSEKDARSGEHEPNEPSPTKK